MQPFAAPPRPMPSHDASHDIVVCAVNAHGIIAAPSAAAGDPLSNAVPGPIARPTSRRDAVTGC